MKFGTVIRVLSDMLAHSIAERVNSVFPDLSGERLYVNRAILAPNNDDADEVNDFVVNQLTGTIHEYAWTRLIHMTVLSTVLSA